MSKRRKRNRAAAAAARKPKPDVDERALARAREGLGTGPRPALDRRSVPFGLGSALAATGIAWNAGAFSAVPCAISAVVSMAAWVAGAYLNAHLVRGGVRPAARYAAAALLGGILPTVAGTAAYLGTFDAPSLLPAVALGLLAAALRMLEDLADGAVLPSAPTRARWGFAALINLPFMLLAAHLFVVGKLTLVSAFVLLAMFAQLFIVEKDVVTGMGAHDNPMLFERHRAPLCGGAFVVALIYMALLMTEL